MGAGAAQFPMRGPQWQPRRTRLALACSAGVHLLAAVWLQQQWRPAPQLAETPRAMSIRLQPPVAPTRPAPAPVPAHERPIHGRHPSIPQPASSTEPAAAAPAPAAAAPASSAPDTLAVPEPAPLDAATLARDPAAGANGSFTVGVAKRQAGRIDHELRGGKSGVPLEADTPWARFQRGLEAAHVERSMSTHLDSYTSPDGVVIYRERVGSRVICRRTGSVGLGVAGAVGVNDAGPVKCPSGVTWRRED